MKSKGKVFVGMSGGVDSSVAAALLKEQGYEVTGVHLKCFNVDGCAAEDAEDARRAAEHLGIPFYTFDYEQEYKDRVVQYMVDGYKKGITPNPDVMCNKEIKFGLFYDKAMKLGADFVATGHYARLVRTSGRTSLAVAKDRNKDQSYFLWAIKPEQLERCLFPIGDYKKPEVRKLAVKFGLHNAAKKDSQGICFLGQVSLPDFLKKYIKPKKGAILDIHGEEIGQHSGAHFYTIGQRHLPGIKYYVSSIKPRYVVSKDIKRNVVVVAEGDENKALYQKEVKLAGVNLFAKKIPKIVYARVRYRQPLAPASARLIPNTKYLILKFNRPVKFVAEGQSAVFYDAKGVLLGGGVIKSAE